MTVPEMSASPSREEVLQALERLLSSRRFIRAGRHSRLLRYVVEETLNGKGPQLKESLLGIEVFGRPAGYDPRVDPVVRVEAAKLRSRIEEYYREDAPEQGVVLEFPRGCYMPRFRYRVLLAGVPAVGPEEETGETHPPEQAKEAAAPAPPRTRRWLWAALAVLALTAAAAWWQSRVLAHDVVVAVLPLEDLSAGRLGLLPETLTAELRARLSRSGGMRVVSKTSSRAAVKLSTAQAVQDAPAIGRELGADVLLEGSMRHGGGAAERLAVVLQLVEARSGLVVWTGRFEFDPGLWEESALEAMASQVRSAVLARGVRG